MLKAVAGEPGNQCLIIGLSFGNIDRFVAQPNDTHIRMKTEDTGLPVDVILFSGDRLTAVLDDPNDSNKKLLLIGLCMEELAIFRNKPLRAISQINCKKFGVPIEILLFSGRTEIEMAEHFPDIVGPNTKYTVAPRLFN